MLQAHGQIIHIYVFHTAILHTESVAYITNSAISNYPLTSFILRVVCCQSYKARLAHTK